MSTNAVTLYFVNPRDGAYNSRYMSTNAVLTLDSRDGAYNSRYMSTNAVLTLARPSGRVYRRHQ